MEEQEAAGRPQRVKELAEEQLRRTTAGLFDGNPPGWEDLTDEAQADWLDWADKELGRREGGEV